jgi:hypothetical protein
MEQKPGGFALAPQTMPICAARSDHAVQQEGRYSITSSAAKNCRPNIDFNQCMQGPPDLR